MSIASAVQSQFHGGSQRIHFFMLIWLKETFIPLFKVAISLTYPWAEQIIFEKTKPERKSFTVFLKYLFGVKGTLNSGTA